jgi:tRNA pseudouridine55 synthase
MRPSEFISWLERGTKGVLLVDKPAGVSSHDVVNWARRVTGVRRIGHTGTLDPLATGLLIILIGRDFTKHQVEYLKADKTYQVTALLGVTTDSYDATGQIIAKAIQENLDKITQAQLLKTLKKFTGVITQTVPPFSAVKKGGKELYKLARQGAMEISSLPTREVKIFSLKPLNFSRTDDGFWQLQLEVDCSSGTYIRSLVHDIGQELGTGAMVTELRRTKIGDISISEALVCPWFRGFRKNL